MSLDKPSASDAFAPLTPEEKRAIASLRRLANRWPETLWLFAAAGSLCVMKTGADGRRQFTGHGGGVSPDYHVTTIREMPCDGGDW